MRLIITIVLVGGLFYWLAGKGIVSLDSVKAKTYINEVQDKLKGLDAGNADMTTVNHEVNKLCIDLRDLSERALTLRQKLMANVVESTSVEKSNASRSRYDKRR